jgi:hypothetical protein
MPRDFSRQPPKTQTVRRQDPAAFGQLVEDAAPRRRKPITVWQAVGLLGAMVFSCLVLAFFFGPTIVACVLTPLLALALYEIWYLTFEAIS